MGKSLVGGIVPVIVAAPIIVEVEIGDVIVALLVAESLVENRREVRCDLSIPRGVGAFSAGFGASGGRRVLGDYNLSGAVDMNAKEAEAEDGEKFF